VKLSRLSSCKLVQRADLCSANRLVERKRTCGADQDDAICMSSWGDDGRTLGGFNLGGNGLGALFKSLDFHASLGLLPAGSGAAGREGASIRIRHCQWRGAAGGRWRARAGWGASSVVSAAGGWDRLRERRRWEQRNLFPHAGRKQHRGWRRRQGRLVEHGSRGITQGFHLTEPVDTSKKQKWKNPRICRFYWPNPRIDFLLSLPP